MTPWTDERVARLTKLWPDWSASEIAAELGGLTRNAVIGKARRLKLPAKKEAATPGRPLKQPRPRAYHQKVTVPLPVAPAVPAQLPTPDPQRLTILDLAADQCRYAVTHLERPVLFCGLPVRPDTAWCEAHHKVVYRRD